MENWRERPLQKFGTDNLQLLDPMGEQLDLLLGQSPTVPSAVHSSWIDHEFGCYAEKSDIKIVKSINEGLPSVINLI